MYFAKSIWYKAQLYKFTGIRWKINGIIRNHKIYLNEVI